MRTRIAATAALTLAVSLSLVGCSGADPVQTAPASGASTSTTAPTASFNDADVMFAQMMLPHHEQAIEMSDMLLAKSDIDPAVADLATRIKDAQGPEIDQMREWLDEWGMSPHHSQMHGMDHGSGHGGMMSEDDMSSLDAASGPEASMLFLEQMIEHHEGAIEMAQDALDHGSHPEVLAMAQSILESQTAEIDEMKSLLAR